MYNVELDANKVIDVLKKRVGDLVAQYETEIAVRDAIINQQQEQMAEYNIRQAEAENEVVQ